jgi:dTDP-4-amino-4,6-dideoxygalactose transaminase
MKAKDIHRVFHYVPLHSAPQGQKIGRMADALTVTTDLADRLVRLPLWLGLEEEQERVIETALRVLGGVPRCTP